MNINNRISPVRDSTSRNRNFFNLPSPNAPNVVLLLAPLLQRERERHGCRPKQKTTERIPVWPRNPDLSAMTRQRKTPSINRLAGFISEWMPVTLSSFNLVFYHSPSSPSPPPSARIFPFCRVEFAYFLQSFHCYLGIVTEETDASSCCGCTLAEALPLCFYSAFIFPFFQEKSRSTNKVYRKPINVLMVSFSFIFCQYLL